MLPPLTERELRVALLRRKAREHWVAAAWLTGTLTSIFLLSLATTNRPASGLTLFRCLFVLQLIVVAGQGFKLTADLFSEERRNGTLGLLVLAGLKPLEIFSGKLLGAGLLTANAVAGTLPFLAVSFLAGGVPGVQFLGALVTLVNTLVFCVAVGLLASVVSREGGRAQIMIVVVMGILGLTTPLAYRISIFFSGAPTLDEAWLALSPLYAPGFVFIGFKGGPTQLFWTACGVTLAYALAALLLAAVILQRTWRDGPEEFSRRSPVARWLNWLRGNARWRNQCQKLLDEHPFAWLAARNRRFVLAAELFIAVVPVAWLTACLVRGWRGPILLFSIVGSALLHLGLNWFMAHSAALALSEERQTGGFEVLLTTPLSVESIVAGQHRAMLLQFKPVLAAVMLLDVVFAISGILNRHWSWTVVFGYAGLWALWIGGWTVAHRVAPAVAMWVGAWTGRPAYAAFVAVRPLVLLMLTFMPVKSPQVLAEKLIRELRLIACAPIPMRGDPRYSGWNPEEIFPPGRWGDMELREAQGHRAWTVSSGLKRTWSRHAALLPARRRDKRF